MNPEIRYAVLDPFNCSVADTNKGIIWIDRKFKDTDIAKGLIEHELKHFKNTSPLYEPIGKGDFQIYKEAIHYKPLMLLQLFFPFILIRDWEGIHVKWNLIGVIILVVFAILLSLVLSLNITTCEIEPVFKELINCKRCSALFGCISL